MKELLETPYEKMVVSCLKTSEAADYDAILSFYVRCHERKLFEFANHHEVAPLVAMRLRHLGKSSPLWNGVADDWKYRLTQRFEKLDLLSDALHAAGIPVMAVKNAAIARAIYPVWEECPMGNFDLLVLPSDFDRATQVLLEAGMTSGEGAARSAVREFSAELADDTLWIRLQTRPSYHPLALPEHLGRTEQLFERAFAVDGCALKIPHPMDHLAIVCMSIVRRRYVCVPGIRMYSEVDRIVRRTPSFPWEAFVRHVRFMGSAAYFALYIPKMLLDTPIPEDVLDALRPQKAAFQRFMAVIRRRGLFYPPKMLPLWRECQILSAICDTPVDFFRALFDRGR